MNSDLPDSDASSSSSSSVPPSRTSSPARSAPASTSASFHGAPTLERLILHFVSAKRSLGSTQYVMRANELVTDSRGLIEEVAVLSARNEFLKRGVEEEVEILGQVRERVQAAGDEVSDEFDATIEKLDRANEGLERTLHGLREAVVDASLQRKSTADTKVAEQDDVEEGSRSDTIEHEDGVEKNTTLYDFIDPSTHENVQAELRKDIDTFNETRNADFENTLSKLDESLRTIGDTLAEESSATAAPLPTLYDEHESSQTTAELFRGMEDEAGEMATLLQGLVKHYDLCVDALKHTEGGGEAAKRAIQQQSGSLPDTEGQVEPEGTMEESLYLKEAAEPIGDEERQQMLQILEQDAADVEDVMSEIKDRNAAQEGLFSQLTERAKEARRRDTVLREVLTMLHEMRNLHLPSHMHALRSFQSSWSRIRSSITDKTESLLSLATSNEGFLSAYGQLLKEVDRRQAAEQQIQKVALKAQKDIQRLHEADQQARHDFLDEFGDFLPKGIWTGYADDGKGVRWEVRQVY